MPRTHDVPTHAGAIEDRLMFGLTVRQLLPLALGGACGDWLYSTVPLPPAPRVALAAVAACAGLALAALRPLGLSLPSYLALRMAHALTPRHTVWRGVGAPGVSPDHAMARPTLAARRARRGCRTGGTR